VNQFISHYLDGARRIDGNANPASINLIDLDGNAVT